MTLSDDLAAAERRAREACEVAVPDDATAEQQAAALDRLMAVCKLAGRWSDNPREHPHYCDRMITFRVELAALMKEMEP